MQNNEVYWNKTEEAVKNGPANRLKKRNTTGLTMLDEKRHIIARDSPINGGAYLGQSKREILIVDDEIDPILMNSYTDFFTSLIVNSRQKKTPIVNLVAGHALESIEKYLPFDKDTIAELAAQNHNKKISLGFFIEIKKGVCRHRALLIGYWIERLIQEGFLEDCVVSIDRNMIIGEGGGGHAWIRFTMQNGFILIIDGTLGFSGPLHTPQPPSPWDYRRPED